MYTNPCLSRGFLGSFYLIDDFSVLKHAKRPMILFMNPGPNTFHRLTAPQLLLRPQLAGIVAEELVRLGRVLARDVMERRRRYIVGLTLTHQAVVV